MIHIVAEDCFKGKKCMCEFLKACNNALCMSLMYMSLYVKVGISEGVISSNFLSNYMHLLQEWFYVKPRHKEIISTAKKRVLQVQSCLLFDLSVCNEFTSITLCQAFYLDARLNLHHQTVWALTFVTYTKTNVRVALVSGEEEIDKVGGADEELGNLGSLVTSNKR